MACCAVIAALIAAAFSLVGWLTRKGPHPGRDAARWQPDGPSGKTGIEP